MGLLAGEALQVCVADFLPQHTGLRGRVAVLRDVLQHRGEDVDPGALVGRVCADGRGGGLIEGLAVGDGRGGRLLAHPGLLDGVAGVCPHGSVGAGCTGTVRTETHARSGTRLEPGRPR